MGKESSPWVLWLWLSKDFRGLSQNVVLTPHPMYGGVGMLPVPAAVALVTHGRDPAGSWPGSDSSSAIKMPILSPRGALGADMKTPLGWNETPLTRERFTAAGFELSQ